MSVQYLQGPVEVFREVRRLLRPGRAVRGFILEPLLSDEGGRDLTGVGGLSTSGVWWAASMQAGFDRVAAQAWTPQGGDPLWVVIGAS